DWRGACAGWAALHLLLGLPLNAWLPRERLRPAPPAPAPPDLATPPEAPVPHARRTALLLSFVFAATWFTSTAMAAHLPRLLQAQGLPLQAAVAAAALVGPAQVAARLLEFGLLRRMHPLASARLAALAHPTGALLLAWAGGAGSVAFTLLHGAGNGILTIAKGTLPLVLFGSLGYGLRQGMLMVPARVAQAFAPLLFGLLLDHWGTASVAATALLGVACALALWWLKPPPHPPA
ncbi:MAG TPA: MFS transporter, partial [Giesbergeria sp.]|nr:MFS transporter [Giesbergeria sp.]